MKIASIKSALDLFVREGFTVFLQKLLWYSKGRPVLEKPPMTLFPLKEPYTISSLFDYDGKINLPINNEPLVSIIIPVQNDWSYTRACIQSIVKNTHSISYEIILADDNSTDETINAAKLFLNIKSTRSDKKIGIAKICNKAAKIAKGKYLMFLGNKSITTNGWLVYLVNTIVETEKVAMVGSQIINSQGKLQFAGGIIDKHASIYSYGNCQNPNLPQYNYFKEVDYITSSAMLIDSSFWQENNGFYLTYNNSGYEAVDLAFRARQNGFKVIYQPKSVVVEFEKSSAIDVAVQLPDENIEECKKLFLAEWGNILKKQFQGINTGVFFRRDRSQNKKHILVIDRFVPQFDKDAGSRSTYSYLCLLVKMGYSVTFIGDDFHYHESYTTNLQQLGIEIIYGNYHKENIKDWLKVNGEYFTHVFIHRLEVTPKYINFIKKFTNAKILYVGHDLHFEKYRKLHLLTNEGKYLVQSKDAYNKEVEIFQSVDAILPFSTYEAEIIQKIVPQKKVVPIPVFFYESVPDINYNPDERKDILFVGGFDHAPNVDAILWFAKNVFPLILEKIPDCKLHVVGSNPTLKVLKLKSDSVFISGYVSTKELSDYYKNCKVAVIPLRFGAGVKGKLIEAFYFQIPSVVTSVAAEGIPEVEEYTIIEDDPKKFAVHLVSVYSDKDKWIRFAGKGKTIVAKYFSEEYTIRKLQEVLQI